MHKSGTFWEKNVVKFLDKDQQVSLHGSSERACGRRVAGRVAGCFLGCLGSGHDSMTVIVSLVVEPGGGLPRLLWQRSATRVASASARRMARQACHVKG